MGFRWADLLVSFRWKANSYNKYVALKVSKLMWTGPKARSVSGMRRRLYLQLYRLAFRADTKCRPGEYEKQRHWTGTSRSHKSKTPSNVVSERLLFDIFEKEVDYFQIPVIIKRFGLITFPSLCYSSSRVTPYLSPYMYRAAPDSNTFDITLLFLLLTNI